MFKTTGRLLALMILCGGLSCGHFQGPRYSSKTSTYVPQGSEGFRSDVLNSQQVQSGGGHHHHSGPFRLRWPVMRVDLSQKFITASTRRNHLGLDLRGRKGEPIIAAHDGIVIYAGSGFRGYGKMIILEYDDTWATLYAHLSAYKVKTGQAVRAGDTIGLMGRTGRASGVHLHFELMRDKIPVDPEPYLQMATPVASTNVDTQ